MTLSVRDLSMSFGGVAAVTKMHLDVGNREIAGLIGPSGAGKTASITCIAGVIGRTAVLQCGGVRRLRRSSDVVVKPEAVYSDARPGLACVPDL
jgi:ABC-type branched-subunit amino acid transport system ATPase component